MVTRVVGNFLIEGDVDDGAGNVIKSARSSVPARHRVRVTNLSTLAYDTEVSQKLPDPTPPRPFSYSGAVADAWSWSWPCLSGPTFVEAAQPLDLHGPAAANHRLWTHQIRYRLANGGHAMNVGGLYIVNSAPPLPVEVMFTVT